MRHHASLPRPFLAGRLSSVKREKSSSTGGITGGQLLLAATPLGNPGDVTPRLRHALATADVVAAEDTRRARALARQLEVEISGSLLSYHDHNESSRASELLQHLHEGKTVLVISDAGMPTVSDPGYRIAAAAAEAGIEMTCLPGPSAPLVALALSGLSSHRFAFDGFPPRKAGAQEKWWESLRHEPRTIIFFESPHRLAETLERGACILGERRAAVCRELTKTYEECRRGTLPELAEWSAEGVKGEITIVIAPADNEESSQDPADYVELIEERVARGERLKTVCSDIARQTGLSQRDLYQRVLEERSSAF